MMNNVRCTFGVGDTMHATQQLVLSKANGIGDTTYII